MRSDLGTNKTEVIQSVYSPSVVLVIEVSKVWLSYGMAYLFVQSNFIVRILLIIGELSDWWCQSLASCQFPINFAEEWVSFQVLNVPAA